MFNANQLAELIIKPALFDLIMFSPEAVQLLSFTCAVESDGGTYIHQINGPALGIYQMEPKTYADIWENFINKKPNILMVLTHSFDCGRMPSEDRLIYDLRFATAMTMLHYQRHYVPFPKIGDNDALYKFYKQYYNTANGKADYTKCMAAYRHFTNS